MAKNKNEWIENLNAQIEAAKAVIADALTFQSTTEDKRLRLDAALAMLRAAELQAQVNSVLGGGK